MQRAFFIVCICSTSFLTGSVRGQDEEFANLLKDFVQGDELKNFQSMEVI